MTFSYLFDLKPVAACVLLGPGIKAAGKDHTNLK